MGIRRRAQASMADVAGAFTQHYYNTFDTNRAALASLYQAQSKLTFEGDEYQGPEAIIGKLTSLKFNKVAHQVVTMDVQDNRALGIPVIIVFITGNLAIEDNTNPLKFAQVFTLAETAAGNGQWFVLNDIFRLNYG